MTLRTRGLGCVALVLLTGVAFPPPTLAQQTPVTDNHPFVLLDVNGGAPLRLSGGATLFVPFGKPSSRDSLHAVEMQAIAGMGGARVAGGMAFLDEGFGPDVRLSLMRTSASPRGATPHATYVGVEAGWIWIYLRLSAGVAQRIAGPSGQKDTVFTWQAGVQLPLWYKK